MSAITKLGCGLQGLLDRLNIFDFLAPLALRLYLAPVFWIAGMEKVNGYDGIVEWFGNKEWGLGLPAPELMAFLATATEVGGAAALLIGLGVRWISLPLMATMAVAAVTVHWHNGWQAIASAKAPFGSEYLGPLAFEDASGAATRLERAKEILQTNGNYEWLTEHGSFVVLNNGIEWATTYFIMLLALFFLGAGRFVSVDYWLRKGLCKG
ncbi:MAG: DoxX family protein [Chromatiales bacterium]|nr:DoxX family protein [Chromatiales bacterium]